MVCPVDLVDLTGFDVDMDKRLTLEQVRSEVECRVLSKGIADGEHDVGASEGLTGDGVTAIPEHPERQRVILRQDALAVERGSERDLTVLDQRPQFSRGAAADRAEPDER